VEAGLPVPELCRDMGSCTGCRPTAGIAQRPVAGSRHLTN
jgi:hypothetical protein